MKPGRELDAKVAEVMGWDCVHRKPGGNVFLGRPNDDYRRDFPKAVYLKRVLPYSTDIAAVWPLWRALTQQFFYCAIDFTKTLKCRAKLYRSAKAVQFADPSFEAVGETAMHAICLVALRATGVEVEDGTGQTT